MALEAVGSTPIIRPIIKIPSLAGGFYLLYYAYAPVAQWIEQETSKLLAVGSIPTRGTNKIDKHVVYLFLL